MLVNILSWQAVFSCRSIPLFLDELNTVEFPCYLLYLPYHKLSSFCSNCYCLFLFQVISLFMVHSVRRYKHVSIKYTITKNHYFCKIKNSIESNYIKSSLQFAEQVQTFNTTSKVSWLSWLFWGRNVNRSPPRLSLGPRSLTLWYGANSSGHRWMSSFYPLHASLSSLFHA